MASEKAGRGKGRGKEKAKNRQMEVVDLKEDGRFIEQYVSLRNSYVDLLLSSPVDSKGTQEWLKSEDIQIRGLVSDNVLTGVVILYLKRGGEITFFAKEKNRGIGSKLLELIEEVAAKRNLETIWSWVLKENMIAQHVFEKSGFVRESVSEREYGGIVKKGIIFKKQVKV